MVQFDNPVAKPVFLRFVGPIIPVWLVGTVLVLFLDRFAVTGASLPLRDLGLLLAVYSVMVAGLVSALYYREWRRSPPLLALSVDGVEGRFPPDIGRSIRFGYAGIVDVRPPGYFTARVEGTPEGRPTVDWLNLTDENARRVVEAWGAWRQREAGAT